MVIPKVGSRLATGATPGDVMHNGEVELHHVIVYLSRDWSVLGLEGGTQFTTMPVWEEGDTNTESTGPGTPSERRALSSGAGRF